MATAGTVLAAADMVKRIEKATKIVDQFKEMPEQGIPNDVLNNAKGLAILTMVKGGFIIAGRGGSGIIVARHADGSWSAPSAISIGGGSVGLQIGAQATDVVLVLNTEAAVEAMSKEKGNCSLGADVSVAAGPVGRSAEAGVAPSAAVYSYSRAAGLFAGVSLEGSIISVDKKVNAEFYGSPMTATQILSGATLQPAQPAPAMDAFYASLQAGVVPKAEAVAPKAEPATTK